MELSQQDYELIERAKLTYKKLYLKDVHEVAAAVRTASGDIFTGIHIEADVGFADVCGEVSAICVMVSAGHRDLQSVIAVSDDSNDELEIWAPCGRCREVIKDFNPDAWVIVGTMKEPYKVTVSELLPLHSKMPEVN